jgi:hypothetical protein
MNRLGGRALLLAAVCALSGSSATPQDLEPRAYSASPVGTTFLVLGLVRSSGSVLADPSIPVTDIDASTSVASIGVGRTFNLASRTALLSVALPYAHARVSGRVGEDAREVTRAGWADVRAKLSINLLGGRALRPKEFAAARRGPIVGASVTLVPPTGQYHADRLINIGSNRWSSKPEVGVSVPLGRWIIDGYAGLWCFTTNSSFFPGSTRREQDPVVTLQGHASYTVRPRLWLAVDATWYSGGTTSANGVTNADLQRNSRFGATVSIPLGVRQSIKGAYSTAATTRIGGDFDTVAVVWQMVWVR